MRKHKKLSRKLSKGVKKNSPNSNSKIVTLKSIEKLLVLNNCEPNPTKSKASTNNDIVEFKQYIDDLKKWVAEHMNDTGFPPKSNELAEATVKALNKLEFKKKDCNIQIAKQIVYKNNQKEFMDQIFQEPIFLENTFEEMAIRIPPGENVPNFGKFKGLPEFEVAKGAEVLLDAIREGKELTEIQYENY